MSRKRISSKPSASSSESPPDRPLLFIDRDAWSLVLGRALTDANIPHIAHRTRFASDSPDTDWIAAASAEGWIAITRDQAIRRKPNEIAAIRASRAIIFVFTSGNLSAADTADILRKALPAIYRTAERATRPALFSIHRDATIGILKF